VSATATHDRRSPPLHPRLAELVRYLDETRDSLLARLRGRPADVLTRRRADGGWSVAEILEHLALVEGRVIEVLAAAVSQARAAGLGAERSTESVLHSLDHFSLTTPSAEKMHALEYLQPIGAFSADAALQALVRTREELRAAIRDANGLALAEISYRHPQLGDLDAYQWILSVGQHEARHIVQIDRTLRETA
jgi:DinB superfamily